MAYRAKMLISKIFKCTHCGGLAHEYHGLEGGLYIVIPTPYSCTNGIEKEEELPDVLIHDFRLVREVAKNEPPNHVRHDF